MKKALNFALAALVLMASFAQAGCNNNDRGSPHPDGEDLWKTKKIITQQAKKNWQDWVWRGESEKQVYKCAWNNAKPECDFMWGQSRSKEWSFGVGGGVSTGLNAVAGWFAKVNGALNANFSADYRRSRTTTQTFNITGSGKRGQFIEPIIVVERRWSKGVFQGGWVEYKRGSTSRGGNFYCYNYDGNVRFGQWETNLAVNGPYRTYHIHW